MLWVDFFFSILCWSCNDNGVGFVLVDVAAREKDPLRRIAFVAAFAMSNYSSTLGRIAKPFNPMLVCATATHSGLRPIER